MGNLPRFNGICLCGEMKNYTEILKGLTEATKEISGSYAGSKGISRTPNFTAPSFSSSRPSSDRGVSFHFAHKKISKTKDFSPNAKSNTASASHQKYIERLSATERSSDEINKALDSRQTSPDKNLLHPGFQYPERVIDPRRISFGTTGNTPEKRQSFWTTVENAERRNARVQSRLIIELPHELDPLSRSQIARDFCELTFEQHAFPYWAVIHAPTEKNDQRNYHMHIAYLDRPCGISSSDQWDFSIVELKKYSCSKKRLARPYRNNKLQISDDINWIKTMRQNFADIANNYLSLAGEIKRYDPRPYSESGIKKQPTEHRDIKTSYLETQGVDTFEGERNAKKEIRWFISEAERPWIERANLTFWNPDLEDPKNEILFKTLNTIATKGISMSRKSASRTIAANLIMNRVARRNQYLSEQIEKITTPDNIFITEEKENALDTFLDQQNLIDTRYSHLASLEEKCRLDADTYNKQAQIFLQEFDEKAQPILNAINIKISEHQTPSNLDQLLKEEQEPQHKTILATDKDQFEITTIINEELETIFEDSTPNSIKTVPMQPLSQEQSKLQTTKRTSDLPDKIINETSLPDERETASQRLYSSRKNDPIELAIQQIQKEGIEPIDKTEIVYSKEDFPGSMPIPVTTDPKDVQKLDALLRTITNKDVRQIAIANRDAADICSPSELKNDLTRGWKVFRFEAQRRGLDLDTGIHSPELAIDQTRAEIHTDQEPGPVHLVKKNYQRQRTRS